jgi:hypothetical protein
MQINFTEADLIRLINLAFKHGSFPFEVSKVGFQRDDHGTILYISAEAAPTKSEAAVPDTGIRLAPQYVPIVKTVPTFIPNGVSVYAAPMPYQPYYEKGVWTGSASEAPHISPSGNTIEVSSMGQSDNTIEFSGSPLHNSLTFSTMTSETTKKP